jgi:hypothetical protein
MPSPPGVTNDKTKFERRVETYRLAVTQEFETDSPGEFAAHDTAPRCGSLNHDLAVKLNAPRQNGALVAMRSKADLTCSH